MKRGILIALSVCMLVACSRGGRVIPASKMADIYADMFLADQWISSHYNSRKTADTSLFYAPIFEKYGYTVEDYDASVKHYVTKPDDYAKILKEAGQKLDKKAKYLRKVDDYYNNKKELFEAYVPKEFVFDSLMVRDTMMDWHPSDTVKLKEKQDTLLIDTLKTKKL